MPFGHTAIRKLQSVNLAIRILVFDGCSARAAEIYPRYPGRHSVTRSVVLRDIRYRVADLEGRCRRDKDAE